jgi:hypothetical protein
MKNQTKFERVDNFEKVIVVLMVVILIVALIIFNLKVFKPNFTIYKNECYNETLYANAQCFYDENTTYVNVIKCQEELNRNPRVVEVGSKEVCNKVEVDKIEYLGTKNKSVEVCNCGFTRCYSNGECGGQFAGIGGFDRETPIDECNKKLEEIEKENSKDKTIISFSALCNNNHFKDILVDVNKSISKKDMTKEWLDEKCECLKCESLNLEKEWGWESVKDGNKIITCSKDCEKYKCGDYEVEVK